MADLTSLVNDLQRRLKEKDLKIKRLEASLESVGIKPSEVASLGPSPELAVLQQKVAELEAKIQGSQKELAEEKQKTAGQIEEKRKSAAQMEDLVKDLQTRFWKRDETITTMEEEAKQFREGLSKAKERPIPEVVKELEGEIKKKDEIIAKLEDQIKDMGKPRLPSQERWWY